MNQSFEIDATAAAVQNRNLPHETITSDITDKLVSDENRAVWAKAERHCCSPSGMKRMLETNANIDIRPLLPTVQPPGNGENEQADL